MDSDTEKPDRSLIDAVRTARPMALELTDLSDSQGRLESRLAGFMKEAGREESIDILYYCLRELVGNAFKANAKRVYFADLKLSLANPADYEKGIRGFGHAYADNCFELHRKAAKSGLRVRVELRMDGELFLCSVSNNVGLAEEEKSRIAERFEQAKGFTNLQDSLGLIDSTEGAGLGLILLCQVLKKMGLPSSVFTIGEEAGQTLARLSIPFAAARLAKMEELSAKLIAYVDALPALPENLASLLEALSDEDTRMADIAERIGADPSMTAYLLKLANSAAYSQSRKVSAIRDAATIIGTRGLRYALLQFGATSILGSPPAGAGDLWRRAAQVSFYARYLAQRRGAPSSLSDDVLVGGVLHDMGMMIQYAVNPKLLRKMEAVCLKREIPLRLLEEIMTGLTHAHIGALLARKWDFPELLVQEIEFHHRPWAASGEHRRATALVYLADSLCSPGGETVDYDQFDTGVLRENGIHSAEELEALRLELARAYAEATAAESRKGR
jgi:HD-like signal output (HDOD) protein